MPSNDDDEKRARAINEQRDRRRRRAHVSMSRAHDRRVAIGQSRLATRDGLAQDHDADDDDYRGIKRPEVNMHDDCCRLTFSARFTNRILA